MTRVKICGLMDVETALAAAEAGADFLGLVFASSRRQLSRNEARDIANAVKAAYSHVLMVGVFVNSEVETLNRIAEYCRLDLVQLNGDETWGYCLRVRQPLIKALRIETGRSPSEVLREIENGYGLISGSRLNILLDTRDPGLYGGTGRTFDWKIAREAGLKHPVIVAGGLTPENVGRLVREVQPWGVDVSSGVETGGRKDIQKIKQFIREVKHNHAGHHEERCY